MFKRLAAAATSSFGLQKSEEELLSLHPLELMELLERAWNRRAHEPITVDLTVGHPSHRSDTPGIQIATPTVSEPPPLPTPPSPVQVFRNVIDITPGVPVPPGTASIFVRRNRLIWDHLIYAYMIENTRIYEIFRRVLNEFLHGEKLGSPREKTLLWLRSTEELFYRAQPSFFITTLDSHIRPDLRASRRNAYQRMFGMELNHGTDENTAYVYTKAEAANNDFVATFVELLRELWVAKMHLNATSAPKPTDDAKIAELVHKLHDMLRTRRQFGNLSREEFAFVSMMSWFHLTVTAGSSLPIIVDLRAEGESPEQRLFKIAQRVGLPAHGLSRGYFEIAEPLSVLLIAIETGIFNTAGAASALYDTNLINNPMPELVNTVITHWDEISVHKIKSVKVVPT